MRSYFASNTFGSCAPPAFLPDRYPGEMVCSAAVRRWKVTHACDNSGDVLALAEAQSELGMRPALLTPIGWFNPKVEPVAAPPTSLIHAWRSVREWRSLIDREDVARTGEIFHAHSFAPAMAALRAALPLVYDVSAALTSAPKSTPWLLRSLRIAENFVLARAGAVVVHSRPMWTWALEQGTRSEDLFLVPEPAVFPMLTDESAWFEQTVGTKPPVTLFACGGLGSGDLGRLLRSFALLSREIDQAHLLVETCDLAALVAAASEFAGRVHAIAPSDRRRALAACDIAIAGATPDAENAAAIDALASGCALLSADVPANREISPLGRGCLWYTAGSERDLAFRAAFLARNPDFRAALAATGREHLRATRGIVPVARRYDEVYRHALDRHRKVRPPDLFQNLPALAAC